MKIRTAAALTVALFVSGASAQETQEDLDDVEIAIIELIKTIAELNISVTEFNTAVDDLTSNVDALKATIEEAFPTESSKKEGEPK